MSISTTAHACSLCARGKYPGKQAASGWHLAGSRHHPHHEEGCMSQLDAPSPVACEPREVHALLLRLAGRDSLLVPARVLDLHQVLAVGSHH